MNDKVKPLINRTMQNEMKHKNKKRTNKHIVCRLVIEGRQCSLEYINSKKNLWTLTAENRHANKDKRTTHSTVAMGGWNARIRNLNPDIAPHKTEEHERQTTRKKNYMYGNYFARVWYW